MTCCAARFVIGEKFDRPAEKMPGRAPDRGAFQRTIGGVHDEPAADLGGKAASDRTVFIQVRRTIKEHALAAHYSPFGVPPTAADPAMAPQILVSLLAPPHPDGVKET
jgi:hypothetical protein